ncbi:MAG TPA: RDD family protein [Candidatus Acidoferrales bacterium]|nr:RDD family protein [Candidatus Acidoferrales bacterium]
MASDAWQKALGLYVTDLTGARLTFGRASGRFFAGRGIAYVPSVGGLYFLIDCIMAGVTEKKQAVHDMIAGCLVQRNA